MPNMLKAAFFNNPFIGLYLRANDDFFLCPTTTSEKLADQGRKALGVEPLKLFINNSPLLGIFSVINSKGAVLSSSAGEREIKLLEAKGLNVCLLETLSPGNNVLANDKGAIASDRVPKAQLKRIGDCLGVEVQQLRFSNFPLVTSTVVTNRGMLAYNDLTQVELKKLESVFGVKGVNGTSNMGVPFNATGVVANSSGALIGSRTSGFESQRIFEALFGE